MYKYLWREKPHTCVRGVGVKEEHPRHYVLSVRAVPYRRGRPLARRERGELRRERGELKEGEG